MKTWRYLLIAGVLAVLASGAQAGGSANERVKATRYTRGDGLTTETQRYFRGKELVGKKTTTVRRGIQTSVFRNREGDTRVRTKLWKSGVLNFEFARVQAPAKDGEKIDFVSLTVRGVTGRVSSLATVVNGQFSISHGADVSAGEARSRTERVRRIIEKQRAK